MARHTLILGMGNPILTDDAVGVRLADDIGTALSDHPDVDVMAECSVGGLNLLEHLEGYRRVVVMDAIHTEGGEPGSCYYFKATSLRPTANLNNIHDANFATALALGRKLGHDLPTDDQIHIFAVEVLDDLTFGSELTPELTQAYPGFRELILAGIRRILTEPILGNQEAAHGAHDRTERWPHGDSSTHPRGGPRPVTGLLRQPRPW